MRGCLVFVYFWCICACWFFRVLHGFICVFAGIFAYLNYLTPRTRAEILEILINGLKRLEYRGYDSAGTFTLPRDLDIDDLSWPWHWWSIITLTLMTCHDLDIDDLPWPWHWWPAVTLKPWTFRNGNYRVTFWFIGWKKRRKVVVKKVPSFSFRNLLICFKCNWVKFFCSKCTPLLPTGRTDHSISWMSIITLELRLFWYSYRIKSFSVKIFSIITSYKFQSDECGAELPPLWRLTTLNWPIFFPSPRSLLRNMGFTGICKNVYTFRRPRLIFE